MQTIEALPTKILDLCNPGKVQGGQVQFDLANMAAALIRLHGEEAAFCLLSEAFASVWAKWALSLGKPIPRRFALEVALDHAQMRAPLPTFEIGNTNPAGAA